MQNTFKMPVCPFVASRVIHNVISLFVLLHCPLKSSVYCVRLLNSRERKALLFPKRCESNLCPLDQCSPNLMINRISCGGLLFFLISPSGLQLEGLWFSGHKMFFTELILMFTITALSEGPLAHCDAPLRPRCRRGGSVSPKHFRGKCCRPNGGSFTQGPALSQAPRLSPLSHVGATKEGYLLLRHPSGASWDLQWICLAAQISLNLATFRSLSWRHSLNHLHAILPFPGGFLPLFP